MSRCVAVFGSSEPTEGQTEYAVAFRTGQALAHAGFTVVTGGYGGVMEAASRGAQDGEGRTIGVISDIFSLREPNPYLSKTLGSADLYERTRRLIDTSDGYVVLPGKAGTLAELTWVWALARAGCLPARPVVPLGEVWRDVLAILEQHSILDPVALSMTELATDEHHVVDIMKRRIVKDSGQSGAQGAGVAR